MAKKAAMAKKARVLWVEGRWSGHPNFIPTLRKKGYKIDIVNTGKAALEDVSARKHDMVIVDAASMRTSGKRICKSLRERVNGMPILLISDPENTVEDDFAYVNMALELPFTSRKLINRMTIFLPGEGEKILKAGPISLDTERKQVECNDKKETLTPRLALLLEMLIEHKGEVVGREELFKKVWRTNYTGDTRTLDVHISWLRQAIEENPRKPQLLKTIRGVGYRLDV
jgi:DNA-binding response OmpR family regulator